jgi:hypothetical protein
MLNVECRKFKVRVEIGEKRFGVGRLEIKIDSGSLGVFDC